MYEASLGGDPAALPAALAGVRLFLPLDRLAADTPGFTAPLTPVRDPATGKRSIAVHTAGSLPPWHPEQVHRALTLGELADSWPGGRLRLAVNPGTPWAVSTGARPADRAGWRRAATATGGPPRGLLLTHAGQPRDGALAHGLGCGAHLSVHNSMAWNDLGATCFGYAEDAARLRRTWGVTHRAGFAEALAALHGARLCGREEALALTTRTALARRLGREPSPDEWQKETGRALDRRRAGADTRAELRTVVERITGYEAAFRRDGLLAAGERVDSLAAFDYGRVVCLVRLGLGARLCDPGRAEEAVLTAGRLSRETYGSWAAFSAAYALARVLAFDEGAFGLTYQESVAQHRVLTGDPASPFRSLPWS
ncbi:DUF1266 domain-containing protein [Streptomyces sp. LP05-1]|uniref:DUF1266 domain-containing protein n=1 Tax=Streptomyces pyxinae TaxID=2970734 RepID=A0ABT2CM12_9ACTN|nr:DUF1266 domain-containing protein [Streptomyces sp. LP05-1]MCS0637609.1 DUF1266 domain-containing protein [Streptomyces sp. LP05-1]